MMNRRQILGISAVASAGALTSRAFAAPIETDRSRPKLLLFDVNETLLDLAPLTKSVTTALGGREDLVGLWFTTMLHYSLVETVGGTYREFGEIGSAAMTMVAENNGMALTAGQAKEAIEPITSLPAHPDVKPALKTLKEAGFRMVTLTNSPQEGVDAQMKNAGLTEYFEKRLSVGSIEIYKPDLRTYKWAAEEIGVAIEDCMLVAAHGWDIAGALQAGMRGAFVTRPRKCLYPPAPKPEIVAADLKQVAEILMGMEA